MHDGFTAYGFYQRLKFPVWRQEQDHSHSLQNTQNRDGRERCIQLAM